MMTKGSLVRERLFAATGIVYVLFVLITLFSIPIVPAVGAPAREVVSYYVTHRQGFLVVNYLYTLELVLFFVFIGYLCSILRSTEGVRGSLSIFAFGTACVYLAVVLVISGLTQALPLVAANPANVNILLVTSDLLSTLGATSFIAAALLVGSVSLAIFQSTALPRWVSIVGWVTVVVMVLASLTLLITSGPLAVGGIGSYVAFAVFALWLLVVSIVLTVKAGDLRPASLAG